jgi:hypothetical protein
VDKNSLKKFPQKIKRLKAKFYPQKKGEKKGLDVK